MEIDSTGIEGLSLAIDAACKKEGQLYEIVEVDGFMGAKVKAKKLLADKLRVRTHQQSINAEEILDAEYITHHVSLGDEGFDNVHFELEGVGIDGGALVLDYKIV